MNMKIPVKDDNTVPWMPKREIPAIKIALSEWRKRRKDNDFAATIQDIVASSYDLEARAITAANAIAWNLEMLYAINERLKKDKECK